MTQEVKEGDKVLWKGITWEVNHVPDGDRLVLRAFVDGFYRFRIAKRTEVKRAT